MRKISITGALRIAALILIVVVGWCSVRDRSSVENWGVPYDYRGDAPQILGWIKAASEGEYIPFAGETISRLGAPYRANWNDYPMYEKILCFSLGMASKVIGIFAASNLGILLGHILSAVSFYLCCRFMKYARTWSFVGAILFSFAYYHFWRGLGHLLLAYSYPLPWAIVTCWIIVASKRMRLGDRLSWVCLITGLVMGLSNPYNLNIFFQLLGFSLLAQYFRRRRVENLKVGLLVFGVAFIAFLAINVGTLAYNWQHGKNPAGMGRHYFEAELYALKPMEFFIPPPTHNLAALADIGNFYKASAYVKGETFSAYLGIVGIVALVWIFSEAFLAMVRNARRGKPFPPYAAQATWIIFYSIIGGFNCMVSLAGMQYFRGTNRYSIYISALGLLFLVSRLSVLSRRWSPGWNMALAAAVLAIGMFDQMPRPLPPEETIENEKIVKNDLVFGRQMEDKLPHGSMVFQMPVMSFPEAVPMQDLTGYEMLRPYLVTRTLRFSFGSVRGRNREAWQWEVEKMPVPEMVETLERYGFGAIYINRRGYADRGEDLLKQLAADGRTQAFEDDNHEQICVVLKPSALPDFPHTDDRAQILFKSGWSIKEFAPIEPREWTSGNATLTFFSESRQAAGYTLRCAIGSIAPRRVSIVMNGQELWSSQVAGGQGVTVDVAVIGHHGNNTIELRTDTEPSHPKDSLVPLAFMVANLQITKAQ